MLGGACKPGLQPRLPLRFSRVWCRYWPNVASRQPILTLPPRCVLAWFSSSHGSWLPLLALRGQRFMGPGFLCSAILWTRCIPGAPNTGDAASAVLLAVAAHKPMLCRAASMFGKHDAQDLRIDVCHADVGYPGYVGYALLRCSGAYAVAFSQGGALDCHLRR